MENIKVFYVLKYALTQGIQKVEGATVEGNMLIFINEAGYREIYHGKGKDWTDDINDALKIAEKMKERKISSLKNQIVKLENLTFDSLE